MAALARAALAARTASTLSGRLLTSSAIPHPQAADPIPLVKAIDDMTEVLSHAGKGLADLMQARCCFRPP